MLMKKKVYDLVIEVAVGKVDKGTLAEYFRKHSV